MGLAALPLTVLLGLADLEVMLLFVAVAMAGNLLISIGSILLATWAETARGRAEPNAQLFSYRERGSLLRLTGAAFLENFGYRQVILYWRLRGLVDFLRGRRVWDKVERIGFSSAPAQPES